MSLGLCRRFAGFRCKNRCGSWERLVSRANTSLPAIRVKAVGFRPYVTLLSITSRSLQCCVVTHDCRLQTSCILVAALKACVVPPSSPRCRLAPSLGACLSCFGPYTTKRLSPAATKTITTPLFCCTRLRTVQRVTPDRQHVHLRPFIRFLAHLRDRHVDSYTGHARLVCLVVR